MTELVTATALWAGALGFGFASVAFLFVAFRLLRSDPHAYRANRAMFGSDNIFTALANSVKGRAAIKDGNSDFYRIHRGLAFNLRTNQLEPQGRPSTEAIRSVNEPIR